MKEDVSPLAGSQLQLISAAVPTSDFSSPHVAFRSKRSWQGSAPLAPVQSSRVGCEL